MPKLVPRYDEVILREKVEELARGADTVAIWANEMLSSTDEETVFLDGVRVYLINCGPDKRRAAITKLASTFGAERADMKRYLRFKGLVNERD